MTSPLTNTTKQLIIIDSQVIDWQSLVGNISPDSTVIILDPTRDGISQIADAVASYSNLDSIHIVSHGSDGSLLLGASSLNNSNIANYADQLAIIGNALTASGDILLYGCDVAQGDSGLAFINSLGLLTGADIAASDNLTGNAAQGGDAILEQQTGVIETTALNLSSYSSVLSATIANNDTLAATEDTPINYAAALLLANDQSGSGSPLKIASVNNFSNAGGIASLNADGSVTFIPTANFNGQAFFSYQATDGVSLSSEAYVLVDVAPVNDAPVAVNDVLSATEDTARIFVPNQLLANDTDVDLNPLTIVSVTSGVGGTAVLNANGTVTFTPNANFNGVADFTYQASDGSLNSNTATATINVAAVNDAPVAVNDTLIATEDTVATYTVAQLLGNDTDVDGNTLTIASVTSGVGGTVVLNNIAGTVTFTPTANFNGVASFTYQASDGLTTSNIATATINVAPVNDAPVAVNDTVTGTEDTPITYTAAQLLGNDTDVDGNSLTISSVTSVTGGIAVLNGDGTVSFTPTANFNGAANFTYQASDGSLNSNSATVTVNVAAVNDPPVAVNDILTTTLEDTPITYTATNLLGNDTDVDGDALSIASVTSGIGGTAVLNTNGTVTFTPHANFNGAASFTYQARDGSLALSNSATATIAVTPVNDAPVAVNDTLAATEDTVITYTAAQLLGNDTDVDSPTLTIFSVTSGTGGTAVLNPDGTVTFTPTTNFNGAASFTYLASDGALTSNSATVTVNVAAVNDAPVAVNDTLIATEDTVIIYTAAQLLGNDTDVEGSTLTIASVTSGTGGTAVLNANGTVSFTPAANFNGAANFSYQASDGSLLNSTSASATVTVNVAAVNDAPVAVNDTLAATEDTPVTYTAAQLLGNDTDVDGPALTIASVTSGTGGTAVLNLDGTVTFTPNANFNGAANFTYQITDSLLTSNTATANIAVAAVNDAPVAVNDTLSATEDTAINYTAIQLLGNDTDVEGNPLTIASVSNGIGGTVTLNPNGTVTFTPTLNFNGAASFTYQASDGSLLNSTSASATVTVNVAAVNDAPVAVNDSLAATEDTPVIYTAAQLLLNDTDVDNPNSSLTIASVSNGIGGTAVLNSNGSVTFTPTLNFNGAASFTYQANDGTSNSNNATATITVAAVNDAPVAVNDALSAIEDTPITYNAAQLLGNDTDAEGDPLTIASVTSGIGGTAVLNAGGTVTFTPNANFNGAASFTYQTTDGSLTSNTATVTINVAPVNDAPVAVSDTLTATEDTAIIYTALQLLGNDTDVEGNPLTIVSVSSGIGGTAVLNTDGTVTFTPIANFNGAAHFTYQANDGTSNSNTATVTINVAPVNDPPVAVNDTLNATEDTPAIYTALQLLGNDTDVDGDPLTIASVTSGTGGTAVLNSDGTVTFTPNTNFNGVADFTYQAKDSSLAVSNSATVTIHVAPVNDAPVAVNDTLAATEDTPINYTAAQLLGNDTDVDGNSLTIASVTSGTGGTVALNTNGSVTFTPTANFNGAAHFSYQASDGSSNSNSATVTVDVAPVNDAPVAVNDVEVATEDTVVIYTVAQLLANDTDVDGNPLTIASVTSGVGGTAVLNAANGTVTFTPNANFNGVADFTYQASDGSLNSNTATATINVAAVNDAPVAVNDTLIATEDTVATYTVAQLLGNDTDVDGNTLTIASVTSGVGGTVVLNNIAGTVTFTPTANFNGVASFTYQASDGLTTSNIATATINVAPVNDAPVAVNDTVTGTEDTPITYTAAQLLGNDTDVDGNSLTISSVTSVTGGIAVLNGDGTVSFTPTANFNGAANFTYQASDGSLNSNSATVTVNVAAVNDPPVAVNDILTTTLEDTPITYTATNLLGNDTDVDGDALSIASVTSGIGGTAVLNTNGTVTFTPHANFNGAASFTYQARDGSLALSNSATATIAVTPVNDAPVAVNDTLAATEDTVITYTAAQLLGNDTDVDSPTLTIFSVTSGTGGTAVLNPDGTVTFTPTTNFNGAASFTYLASDGALTSNSATVTVNVAAVNDAPVAVNDTLIATEDTVIIYTAAQLLGNDTDVEGSTLTIASVTSGTGGTAVLNANGTVSFTPAANFNGAANFSYQASDGSLLNSTSASATVTVNVAAVNDAPVAVNDTLAATEDTPVTYTAAQLLGNDTDVDGPALTIASVTSGTGGTAVLNLDGTVTFTPNANFNGAANFTYQITDSLLTSNTATANIAVAAVNDAPVAVNDTLSATEDTAINYTAIQLLGNDTDVEGNPLTIASVSNGIGGTVTLNPNGTVTFTPTLNFNGAASFTYQASDGSLLNSTSASATVTVNVAAVNDAPVAVNDSLAATEDTPVIYTAAQLLLNDTDVDNPNSSLTIASVSNGIGGTAVLNSNGSVTFTPTLNFNGAASFTYQANDGTSNSNNATATITVAAVNDAPIAVNDTLTATEDTPITYTAAQLLGNDTDVDSLTLSIASVTSGTGGVVVLNGNGTVTFTPTLNFNGAASFTYQTTDGSSTSNTATVTINVAPVNDAPVAVNDVLVAIEDTPINYAASLLLANDTDVDGNILHIGTVLSGAGGTATLNANGTVTFIPIANFNGPASFTYQANDGTTNSSNIATVTINVAAVNDAPVAVNDTLTATEDTAVTYLASDLLGNDTDVDVGDLLTIASVTSGTGGTAVLNNDGTVTFTPNANFNGVADFTYQARDSSLLNSNNSAKVTVNVAPVNDAPVAVNDTLAATEDTPVIYTAAQLLGNDTDVDGNSLTIFSVTSGTGGTAVLNTNGTVTFTPNANFNGVANFTYLASDGLLNSNSATATIHVAAVNDAPVAVNDAVVGTEDTVVVYTAAQLLANDTDVDGNPLTIASVTSGVGGTAVLNANGTVTFTPNANFNGVADFTYQASDGLLLSNSASVTINVAAVNDAPVAVNDILVATEDTLITYNATQLLGNDTDADLDPLVITSVTSGTGGVAVLNTDGTVTFTPTANFNGAANFTYQARDGSLALSNTATVTINVAAVNDAPVAVNDTLAATEDTVIIYNAIQLLGNDTDVDGNPLTIDSVSSGTGGTVLLNPNGTVKFTPNANFNGVANFTYLASDGTTTSNSATATINVAAVNDAPVAVNDTLVATEDTVVTYTASLLLGNDTDIELDPLTIASVTSGVGGTVVLNTDNTVTFTPTANFNGAASFTYLASDGTTTSNSATATINVIAVNDPPVAVNDTLAATEDTPATYTAVQLLGNDTDVDGNILTITSVTSGVGGVAVLNPNGTVTFIPTANFNGAASFTYQASDGTANSNTATVTINVAAVNDAPVAVNDTLIATEDTVIIYTAAQLLGNDTDVEGSPLTIASVTSGTGGTVVLNPNGTVTFTPSANFDSAANFSYKASDGSLNSNSATVTINVTPVNDAPVLATPTVVTYKDTMFVDNFISQTGTNASGTLVGTDVDLGTTLDYGITGGINSLDNFTVSKSNAYGTLTVTKATGAYIFTPDSTAIEPLGANVTDSSIVVTVSDGILSANKIFSVTITQQGATETIGNNTLTGFSTGSVDTWAGLNGNDTYYVDNIADSITELANAGTDVVYSTANSYTLSANIEVLVLQTGAINGTGNDQGDLIVGNTAANLLTGGTGIDTLDGGVSDVSNLGAIDTLNGGAGNDTFRVQGFYAEGVYDGGVGTDTLDFSQSDAFTSGVRSTNHAGVAVNLTMGVAITYYQDTTPHFYWADPNGHIALSNIENVIGTNQSDEIVGDGYDNILDGGVSDVYNPGVIDYLYGRAGNDTFLVRGFFAQGVYDGGAGTDTLDFSQSDAFTSGIRSNNHAGVAVNLTMGLAITYYQDTTPHYYWADPNGHITLSGIENIRGTSQNDELAGDSNANVLEGGAGNDILNGGDGADTYIGGLGADTINLTETTPATDTVRIAAGDSLATVGDHDTVYSFDLYKGVVGSTGFDQLDLVSTNIAANATVDGADVGVVMSHSITNGLISFAGAGSSPLTITTANLADVFGYLQANITGSNTVAFIDSSNNTYIFQDGNTAPDTLVELVGVSATGGLNTTQFVDHAIWIV
jgi:uncharacterized membrane protein